MPSPATLLRAPLLWLLFPVMAGFIAARLWALPTAWLPVVAIAGAACAALAFYFAGRTGGYARRAWALTITAAGALGGFAFLHYREPQLHSWDRRPPREATLTLEVQQLYPGGPRARSLSGLGRVVSTSEPESALVGRRVYFSALRRVSVTPLRSGTYVVRGVLSSLDRAPAVDSFNAYLVNLGIRQTLTRAQIVREVAPPTAFRVACNRAAARLEASLRQGLERHPEITSLYLAMLLGEKAALSPDQQNAFMRSGTFHIFSISGLHVGVIAIALHSVLRLVLVPKRATVALTILSLWAYLEITGINSPGLRAFIMIAFLSGSQIFRLPGNALAALAAAALVTLLVEPLQLFTAGFQMSYAVVSALVLMAVPLTERINARWQPFALLPRVNWTNSHHFGIWLGRKAISGGAAGWVAFLSSAVSGIGYFGLFSPGSLLANLIIVPLSSLAIISGFLSLLVGLAGLTSLCALFNSSAALAILAMDWLAQRGTAVPGMYFDAHFVQPWLAPAGLCAMTATLLAAQAGRWQPRYGGFWPPVAMLAGLLAWGVNWG